MKLWKIGFFANWSLSGDAKMMAGMLVSRKESLENRETTIIGAYYCCTLCGLFGEKAKKYLKI